MRVPSANLSCIAVDGKDSSTERPTGGGELGVVVGEADAGAESVDDPPPSVLPTPWNGVWRLTGSCRKGLKE